jgi:hypothetical protein
MGDPLAILPSRRWPFGRPGVRATKPPGLPGSQRGTQRDDHRLRARSASSTRYSSPLETLDSSEGCEITNASRVGTKEAVTPTVTGPNESRQWLGPDLSLRMCRPRRANLVPKGQAMFHVKPRRATEFSQRMEIPPMGPFPSAVSLGSGPPAGSEDQRDERQRAHWFRVRLQRRTVRPIRRSAPPLTVGGAVVDDPPDGGASLPLCGGSAVLRWAWCDRPLLSGCGRPPVLRSTAGLPTALPVEGSDDRRSCRSTVAPPAVVRLTVLSCPVGRPTNAVPHEASAHGRAGGHGAATSRSEDTPVHCRLTGARSRRPAGDESEPGAKVPPMRVGPWALLVDPADAGHRWARPLPVSDPTPPGVGPRGPGAVQVVRAAHIGSDLEILGCPSHRPPRMNMGLAKAAGARVAVPRTQRLAGRRALYW